MKWYKVDNEIFEFNLKPSSFRVYITLSNMFYNKEKFRIKLHKIAKHCNISTRTAQDSISELINKGLICKSAFKRRVKTDSITLIQNETNQYELLRFEGKYTLLERTMLNSIKDNSAFMLICAVAKFANDKGRAYPSYPQLVELTGLSRSTVIRKIALLSDHGYLGKAQYIKLDNRHGHNNYIVMDTDKLLILLKYLVLKLKSNQPVSSTTSVEKAETKTTIKKSLPYIISKLCKKAKKRMQRLPIFRFLRCQNC